MTDTSERDTIISTDGREVDITAHIEELLRAGETRDYMSPDGAADIRRFGVNLILVAGDDAPARIIEHYAKYMSVHFERFLWKTWAPLVGMVK